MNCLVHNIGEKKNCARNRAFELSKGREVYTGAFRRKVPAPLVPNSPGGSARARIKEGKGRRGPGAERVQRSQRSSEGITLDPQAKQKGVTETPRILQRRKNT